MFQVPSVKSDDKYRDRLVEIFSRETIPEEWQDSPIEQFIMWQNLGWPLHAGANPELLISTCIEFRYALPIPRQYAYVVRRASGRLNGSEFTIGYTLAKGVRHLIMIGHNDCGMAKVAEVASQVVESFVEQGWSKEAAEEYVRKQGANHAIGDELIALKDEYIRLRSYFKKLTIAPLFVCLNDNKLYIPHWYKEVSEALASAEKNASVSDELIKSLP